MHLYMIERENAAPYPNVIICTNAKIARRMAGGTDDKAWVWEMFETEPSCKWTLMRWNGFDLDYGGMVHCIALPDGSKTYDHEARPRDLYKQAKWWSINKLPIWLRSKSVSNLDSPKALALLKEQTYILKEGGSL